MANLVTLWEQQKSYPTQSFDSWCQGQLQIRLDAEESDRLEMLSDLVRQGVPIDFGDALAVIAYQEAKNLHRAQQYGVRFANG
jgi:hypothetical protein